MTVLIQKATIIPTRVISRLTSGNKLSISRGANIFKIITATYNKIGIKTIKKANEYLRSTYIKEYNKRFSIKPEQKGTAFISVPNTIDLNKIFCFKHERTVNNDNTISFNHRLLQIGPSELRVSFAKCRVTLYEHMDGSISIGYGPHSLGYYLPKNLSTYSHYKQKEKRSKKEKPRL